MQRFLMGLSLGFLIACGEEKTEDGNDSTVDGSGSDDSSNVDGSGCPSDVPEEYRYSWDCENQQPSNTGDPCSVKLYRYGVGESSADGSFTMTEKWFSFEGVGSYCVDTFEITGMWDSREPSTFGASTAEELFGIQWQMVDSQCEIIWSPLFADQEADDPTTQTYVGALMLDTHTAWKLRNPDYAAQVIAAPINGNQYAVNSGYAQGTVIPTGEHEAPGAQDENGDWCCEDLSAGEFQPASYTWVNEGDCLQ